MSTIFLVNLGQFLVKLWSLIIVIITLGYTRNLEDFEIRRLRLNVSRNLPQENRSKLINSKKVQILDDLKNLLK